MILVLPEPARWAAAPERCSHRPLRRLRSRLPGAEEGLVVWYSGGTGCPLPKA